MGVKEDLINYYSNKSKHSNYQVLPEDLKSLLKPDDVRTRTRYEKERLDYLLKKISMKGKTLLDIGGNTGYFSFEAVRAGAKSAHCYEGNKEHAEFVQLAARALNNEGRITVTNGYFSFDGSFRGRYDIILLFNVLHHVGDDYGDKDLTAKEAQDVIANQLNSLIENTDTLVYQMGFNWKGDIDKPLFEKGTKQEMIDFVRAATKGLWEISAIGVPERLDGQIIYKDLNDKNIARDDSLGEFLNRPIFILKSKANK